MGIVIDNTAIISNVLDIIGTERDAFLPRIDLGSRRSDLNHYLGMAEWIHDSVVNVSMQDLMPDKKLELCDTARYFMKMYLRALVEEIGAK